MRVPSSSVAAASKARFALSSKRTPTSLFSLTSVSGFLSVDAPEPIVIRSPPTAHDKAAPVGALIVSILPASNLTPT